MQSLVFKRWADILEEEASNLNSDDHDDDLVPSPKMLLYLLENPLK